MGVVLQFRPREPTKPNRKELDIIERLERIKRSIAELDKLEAELKKRYESY